MNGWILALAAGVAMMPGGRPKAALVDVQTHLNEGGVIKTETTTTTTSWVLTGVRLDLADGQMTLAGQDEAGQPASYVLPAGQAVTTTGSAGQAPRQTLQAVWDGFVARGQDPKARVFRRCAYRRVEEVTRYAEGRHKGEVASTATRESLALDG